MKEVIKMMNANTCFVELNEAELFEEQFQ